MKLALALIAALALQATPKDVEPTLERWRESLELDFAREIVDEGRARVGDGDLREDGRAIALVARALRSIGDQAGAQRLLDNAKPTDATRTWIELEHARALLEADELAKAERLLVDEQGQVRHREVADNWLLLGRVRARAGDVQKAAPLFKHFVELAPLSPDAPSAYHQIALALVQRGDAEGATRVFEHAAKIAAWHGFYRARRLQIREHPSAPLPRLGLGQLLLEADQLDRARAVLEELVRVAPTFANGWFHLGECARKQQDLDAATRHYGKALELDPALDVARYNRAVIAVMQRRDPHARADLERIVEGGGGTDPRLINAHLELARLLARAGDPSGAKARHARYVELGGAEPLNP